MSTPPSASSFDGEDAMLQQLRTRGAKGKSASAQTADRAQRQAMIAEAAYYRAERRGFEPGHELEDWLGAEAELARSLR